MQTQKDLESTPGKLNSSGSQRDPLADSREKSQRIQLPGCTVVGIAEEARADEGTEINGPLSSRQLHRCRIKQDQTYGPKTITPIDCRSCNVLAFFGLQDLTPRSNT
ncbi:hypothetical protein ALC53_00155 [Atta colombica]|uniref:Uncharacterized protein n=1 Tax=Atta colombica TaxID=520822 RepID=A0A195BX54_9HYME|nr:hypothetical protein ALC53_00155 [Atta colombica]